MNHGLHMPGQVKREARRPATFYKWDERDGPATNGPGVVLMFLLSTKHKPGENIGPMQNSPFAGWRGVIAPFFIAAAVAALPAAGAPAAATPEAANPVTVTDSGRSWTLDNGIVKAVIDKRNGAMDSLIFRGIDTMGHDQGQSGYWEQDPSSAAAQGALTDSDHH